MERASVFFRRPRRGFALVAPTSPARASCGSGSACACCGTSRAAVPPASAAARAGPGSPAAPRAGAARAASPRRLFHATAAVAAARKRDPYDVLGVGRGAAKDDVKKAYYKLVKQYHPDVNKDDASAAAKFQEVQAAYEILSDDGKRAAYDAAGHAGVDAESEGGARAGGGGGGGGGFPGGIDPEELFAAMFGGMMGGEGGPFGGGRGGGGGGGPRRGADAQTTLTVSFMEAVNGCSKSITAPVLCSCAGCAGTGSADGSKPVACKACRGSGQTTMQQGVYTIMSTCRACSGAGTVLKDPCRKCSGLGVQRRPKTVSVSIPPGVDTGVNLRLAGEGDCGLRGAPAGNLFVRVSVEADPFFERDGTDVHVRVPLSIVQACLGATVGVPTIRGEERVVVPPGTQPGDTVTLRGKGVRRLGASSTGNQIVHLDVQVPRAPLSPKLRELLAAVDAELKGGAAGGGGGGGGGGASTREGTGTDSASWAKTLADTIGRVKKFVTGSTA